MYKHMATIQNSRKSLNSGTQNNIKINLLQHLNVSTIIICIKLRNENQVKN